MAISYDADELGRTPSSVDGMPLHPNLQNRAAKRKATMGPRVEVSSRAELMASLKRGESPTWVPNPALEALIAEYNIPSTDGSSDQFDIMSQHSEDGKATSEPANNNSDLEIERPRSALHSGDFDDSAQSLPEFSLPPSRHGPTSFYPPQSTSPPWPPQTATMGRNFSSSFAFQAPTSPLAQATSLELDTDFDRESPSPEKAARRRTLPPDSYLSLRSPSDTTNFGRPFPGLRRESSLPYQAHQPRRSSLLSTSNPMTSLPRSRRTSFSDHSPRQLASMVGSFEESLIRGRMSTAPSKPLTFIAKIGTLGEGKCKASLRFPKHVTVPFPAVFYNYPSLGNQSVADEGPSPYVGTIDLEHSLKPLTVVHRKYTAALGLTTKAEANDVTAPETTPVGVDIAVNTGEDINGQKLDEELKPPPVFLGGSYRVAKKGKVQIVIKNPNRTAVKFFLIPYNLDGMKSGTKTFIRQRCFSTGPIWENLASGNPNLARDSSNKVKKTNTLRYLIHLKFCCPAKDRFFLYGDIRVVFANRVPDNKEKLKMEIQRPEPRYSSFRREPQSLGSARAKIAANKALEQSSGFSLTRSCVDAMDGLTLGSEAPSKTFHRLISRMAEDKLGKEEGDESAEKAAEKPTFEGISPFTPSTASNESSDTEASIEPFTRTVSPTLSDPGESLLSRELRLMQEDFLHGTLSN